MNKGQSDILDRLENAELKGGDKHGLGGDGGDGGGKAEAKEIPKVKPRGGGGLDFLAKKSPEECFHEFDTDHSGLIDYEEFQQMLPRLNIDISEAKTLRYFRMCDEDNSGAIDLDEFKVSLYCMDPVNGNTVGFSPSNLVSPVDAFEMYDEDRSGNIDEDEFALVLEYLGLNITDERQEKMFLHYDKDKSGTISYDEFKIIWLEVVNKKQELENRGVKVGRFESATTVKRKLERIVHDEEQQELKAMAMANQFRQWTNELVRKKEAIAKAKSRRAMELSSALDSAGQVYVFGSGTQSQFTGSPVRPGQHFEGFDFVHDLWTTRVHPASFVEDADPSRGKPKKVAAQPKTPKDEDDTDGVEGSEGDSDEDAGSDSDSDASSAAGAMGAAVDARKFGKSPFEGTVCGDTATLWGRRVAQCGSGASAAFACNDRGELFCWGGRDAWWREINAEDGSDAVVADGGETKEDDPILGGGMTERSQLLLNVRGKMAWAVEEEAKEQKQLDDDNEQRPDDILADKLKAVCQYFDEWEPAPTNDTRLQHLQNVLLPCVEFDAIRLSVDLRGQSSDNKNKQDLVDILFECLEIEEMAMPEGGSSRLRKMELDYAECKKRGRSRMAEKIGQELKDTWAPLEQKRLALGEERRVRAVAAKEATHTKVEEGYRRWRAVQQAADEEGDPGGALALAPARNRKGRPKKGAKGSGRRGQGGKAASGAGGELALVDEAGAELVTPGSSSRGGGQSTGGSSRRQGKKRAVIQPIGVTARGPGPHIIPKSGRCRIIGVGGYHAAAVHTSGDLYVWGCGNYGRLGLGSTDNPDGYTRASKGAPTKCETIASVEDVACGFSHSALVTTDQRLYVWGAGTTGKLGLGPITEQFECYCPEPTLLTIPGGRKVRMASCGHAHTAVVCMSGELFVWGSGDGGRLGLGKDRTGTFLEPVLVENLRNLGIRMWDVACGKAHTLAATRVREVFRGEGEHRVRIMDGGKLFQAGTAMAVGSYTPAFAPVERLADQAVKSISAGDTHSGCVTVGGELFTWGSNAFGACGQPIVHEFIPKPTVVSCLYVLSKSLAIGKMVRQSSVYNKRGPTVVNNGVEIGDGENFCCHTQLDQQAWWDVDLGGLAVIDTITIHNREDSPADSSLGDDHFSKRLFPVWAILSVEPFTDEVGGQSLNDAFAVGTAMKKFTKNRRKIIWELPSNSIGRYVRIQLEGVNYLHIAEVGVFGCWGTHKNVGRVGRVSCGAGVTLATIEALKREADLEQAYVRAIKCDPFCALVLRQYHSFFEAYRVWGEGGDDLIDTCPLCRGGTVCEICQFHRMWPMKDKLPSGPGGRLRRFDSIARLCEEEPPPPLDFVAAVLPDRSWGAWFRKKLKLVWSVVSGKQRKQKKLDALRLRQEKALAAAKEDESDEVPFDDDDSDSTSSDED